jgi:integrase/recombinase XerD
VEHSGNQSTDGTHQKADEAHQVPKKQGVRVEVLGQKVLVRMQKDQTDIAFIRGLRYSRWDGKQFCWVVPNYPGNLEVIKDYFGKRIGEFILHEGIPVGERNGSGRAIMRNELLIIRTSRGRLKLIFAYNAVLSNYIKKMPYHAWDSQNKWWTIPWSERFLEEIKELAKTLQLEIIYEEEKQEAGVRRITPVDIPNYRTCPVEYRNKMIELRYSSKTIQVYVAMFEEFLNYHHRAELREIDDRMIIAFLQYLVMERKVSPSYQNQAINAIVTNQ